MAQARVVVTGMGVASPVGPGVPRGKGPRHMPHRARRADPRVVLSNSFVLGGRDTALVFRAV